LGDNQFAQPAQEIPVVRALALMLLLTSALAAQTYQDSLSFGGIGYDCGYGVAADTAGNTYASGHFDGTVDIQPGSGTHNITGYAAGFAAKYDTSRNVTWSYLMQPVNAGDSVIPEMPTVDPAGNVYVVGRFFGMVDFDPVGTAVENALDTTGTPAQYCAFVLKISATGAFQWVRVLPGSYSWAVRVSATSSRVCVTGIYSGTMDMDPTNGTDIATTNGLTAFIALFDASGNRIWGVANGGNGLELPTPARIEGDEVTYVSGYIIDVTLGQGGTNYPTIGNCDMLIVHIGATGAISWLKQIGQAGANIVPAWLSDHSGSLYVSGSMRATCDFDPGSGVTNLTAMSGVINGWVASYTASGDLNWGGVFESTADGNAFACAADAGGVVVSGQMAADVDLDTSGGVQTAPISNGPMYAGRYSTTGAWQWSVNMGTGATSVEVFGAASTGNGTYLVCGPYTGTADWDPGAGTATTTEVAGEDGFIVWLNDAAASTPPALDITTAGFAGVVEGTAVNVALSATGGSASGYQWSVVSGALPPGITGLPGTGTPSISLMGTPTTAGSYNFRVRVQDDASNSDEQDFAWTILPVTVPPPGGGGNLGGGGGGGGGCAVGGGGAAMILTPLALLAWRRRRRTSHP